MRRRVTGVTAWVFGCAALVLAPAGARAVTCALDTVPAATLLLPYFEVDLADANGRTTLFSINNATERAALAHVVLWTDMAVPTLAFDVYLTGYDVQSINLRDVLNGVLPQTADAAHDPADQISPQGDLSTDVVFPDCAGLLPPPAPPAGMVADLRAAHTGLPSPLSGLQCAGLAYGDNVARGYVTVDVARRCSGLNPSDAGYFGPAGVAADDNVLWGDVLQVDSTNNFAQGENLVRIESSPATLTPGEATFYGRYTGTTAADAREPLGTVWATRFVAGAAFSGGTDLVVWRDTQIPAGRFQCGSKPNWYPLFERELVTFDEEENPVVINGPPPPITPPPPIPTFPAATARKPVDAMPNAFPFELGWAYLNLHPDASNLPGFAQSWVGTVMSAEGRYSAGFDATVLESACDPDDGGGILPP